jgi:hypothetical protein
MAPESFPVYVLKELALPSYILAFLNEQLPYRYLTLLSDDCLTQGSLIRINLFLFLL